MVDELKFRMDNFYRMCIVNKLRDIVPGAVQSIMINEICVQLNKYLMILLEDNTEIIESLSEEDDLSEIRKNVKEELLKLNKLKNLILINPSGKN